jgi:hypothetical protein
LSNCFPLYFYFFYPPPTFLQGNPAAIFQSDFRLILPFRLFHRRFITVIALAGQAVSYQRSAISQKSAIYPLLYAPCSMLIATDNRPNGLPVLWLLPAAY